ncbi:protein LURP-one-related 8-like [Rutidosis leptorrhynchoides]|uniref:protein LURP-one-related 8-like n=1 Tax=Rutidosis leptorrhynchoides TaxID=125765 RepID=UPI003A9963F4
MQQMAVDNAKTPINKNRKLGQKSVMRKSPNWGPNSDVIELKITSVNAAAFTLQNRVYPQSTISTGVNQVILTVWKKSLLFGCDGFTVFDSNGNLVYRVDNYVAGRNGEIVLMSSSGRPLFTIRRKMLSLSESWMVYDGETTINPRFSVKKHHKLHHTKSVAYVNSINSLKYNTSRNKKDAIIYEIGGSYAQRCCVVYDDMHRCVADIRRKEAKKGVALGDDVFQLVVQPLEDPSVAMALVIVLDQMFGSSRRFLN